MLLGELPEKWVLRRTCGVTHLKFMYFNMPVSLWLVMLLTSVILLLFLQWRSRALQLTLCLFAGMTLGTFTIILLGGIICQTLGWPFAFYILGKLLSPHPQGFFQGSVCDALNPP